MAPCCIIGAVAARAIRLSDTGVDLDVTRFALSARVGYPVMDPLLLYVGGGVHYTMFDVSASTLDVFENVWGLVFTAAG